MGGGDGWNICFRASLSVELFVDFTSWFGCFFSLFLVPARLGLEEEKNEEEEKTGGWRLVEILRSPPILW